VKEALDVLGYELTAKFGSFTGNLTLIRWFGVLNKHFGNQKGKARICYKVGGKEGAAYNLDSDQAMKNLVEGLQNSKKAYVYHCEFHYMVPVGF
jgi:hypothetical protein